MLVNLVTAALQSPWTATLLYISLIIGCTHLTLGGIGSLAWLLRLLAPKKDVRSYGQWAVVTGATDGIGKAYCLELAKHGINIILLSRTADRLTEASKEIEGLCKVKTRQLCVDFSNVSAEKWMEIRNLIADVEVGVLVNNVGCSYEHYEYLHLVDQETMNRLIEINVRATIEMTRIVLPQMLSRKKGVILNIGSGMGSLLPASPLVAVYAGTKAFVEQFSKSCYVEYKDQGIIFQDQAPLFVTTKLSKIRKSSLTTPSPTQWVKGAIAEIGHGPLTSGYWIHNLIWILMQKIPTKLLNDYSFSFGHKIRAKALKKKALNKKD